jgi:predicted NBD/HSP70 family sugar kinase
VGCLERICSTAFLRRLDGRRRGTLAQRATEGDAKDKALSQLVDLLATGIANAVNFVRPHRLVLIGSLMRCSEFTDALVSAIRSGTLDALAERLRVDRWDQTETSEAEPAGWLALAELYFGSWSALPLREEHRG